MKRFLSVTCVLMLLLGAVTLAHAEPVAVKSETVNSKIAKSQYNSSAVYKATYKGHYDGADGKSHTVLVQALSAKRDQPMQKYSWSKASSRAAGTELKIKVFQDGKAVLMADDPYGNIIEAEVLMPSGDIVEIVVDSSSAKTEFLFMIKPVMIMEGVIE